jgi:hypothetical protein
MPLLPLRVCDYVSFAGQSRTEARSGEARGQDALAVAHAEQKPQREHYWQAAHRTLSCAADELNFALDAIGSMVVL